MENRYHQHLLILSPVSEPEILRVGFCKMAKQNQRSGERKMKMIRVWKVQRSRRKATAPAGDRQAEQASTLHRPGADRLAPRPMAPQPWDDPWAPKEPKDWSCEDLSEPTGVAPLPQAQLSFHIHLSVPWASMRIIHEPRQLRLTKGVGSNTHFTLFAGS